MHSFIHSYISFHECFFQAISVQGTLLGTGQKAVRKKQFLTSLCLHLVGDVDVVFAGEPIMNPGLGSQERTLGGSHPGTQGESLGGGNNIGRAWQEAGVPESSVGSRRGRRKACRS